MQSRTVIFSVAAVIAALLIPVASGQTSLGSISGLVADQSGAAVPDVAITVTDVDRNATFRSVSNESGFYVVAQLPPGAYSLSAEASGFSRYVLDAISVSTQQKISADIVLELGAVTESVSVTANALELETGTSTLSAVIENKKIVDLPLNGRNVFTLALLTAGVYASRPTSSTGGIGEAFHVQGRFIANGGRESSNAILLDGVSVNSNGIAEGRQFATGVPSADGIQEFRVQTNGFSAEYGRTGGGVLTLVTKSGTNDVHGSMFWYMRDSSMDANNFFANAAGRELGEFERHEYGGSVGGPIVPDRAFYFVNLESRYARAAALRRLTLPTASQHQGDFSETRNAGGALRVIHNPFTTQPDPATPGRFVRDAFPNNRIPPSMVDAISRNILDYYPEANSPGNEFTNQFNWVGQFSRPNDANRLTTKADYNLSDRQRLFVRYNYFGHTNDTPQTWADNPACPHPDCVSIYSRQQNAALDYTNTINARTVLNMRWGLGRSILDREVGHLGFRPSSLGYPEYMEQGADVLMFPRFNVQDFKAPAAQHHLNYKSSIMVHTLLANLTRVAGRHNLKFGGDVRFNFVNYSQRTYNPVFNFNRAMTQGPDPRRPSGRAGHGLASFLLGTGARGALTHNSRPASANRYFGIYLQDDYKVNRKLTLNLGLRWDIETGKTERYDRITVFDPAVRNPVSDDVGFEVLGGYLFPGKGMASNRLHPTQWKNLNPRFGFAYQVGAKTLIRGGYGIFFDAAIYGAAGRLGSGTVYNASTQWLATLDGVTPFRNMSDPFPDGINFAEGDTNGVGAALGQAVSQAPFPASMPVPYNQQWNFTIQRSLGTNLLWEVAYAGSKGTHLPLDWQVDQLHPDLISPDNNLLQLVDNPFSGIIHTGVMSQPRVQRGHLLTPFPQYPGARLPKQGWGNSNYHSFQTRLEQRFAAGTSFMVAYTFAKTISDGGDDVWTGANETNAYCRHCDRSVSVYNQTHRLVTNFTYELPFGRGKRFGGNWSKGRDAILGQWQINGIGTLNSGLPLRFRINQNTSRSFGGGQRPNSTGQSAGLGSAKTLRRWFDPDQFTRPAQYTFGNVGRVHPTLRDDFVEALDFSLFKNFRFRERWKVQFRAEAFNVFNHPVFGGPNTVFGNPNFGRVVGQANGPRQLQLALRLQF